MDTLIQDVRWGLRALRSTPTFTAIALLTLALGIGANTAIFSVVDGVLLRSLPYEDPGRLYSIYLENPSGRVTGFAVPAFMDWRQRHTGFDGFASTSAQTTMNLTGPEEPQHVTVKEVTANFFSVLGVDAELGRTFATGEDTRSANAVAVLSHDFWRQRYAGDPQILGSPIRLNGTEFSVVGVMPEDFAFAFPRGQGQDLFIPRVLSAREEADNGYFREHVIGRLAIGVTAQQAHAEGVVIQALRLTEVTNANTVLVPQDVQLVPLQEKILGNVGTTLWLLLGAVGIVLLVAAANVANLVMTRNASRQGEITMRAALGASRARLVRQTATEMILLATAGGGLGIVAASWLTATFASMAPAELPRIAEVTVDGRVLAFTATVSLLLGLVLGVLPALRATRQCGGQRVGNPGGRGTADRGHHRVLSTLVAAECALVFVLLVAAGLVLSSYIKVRGIDPGFDTSSRLSVHLTLSSSRYPDPESIAFFFERTLEELHALPGVRAAGGTWSQALAGSRRIRLSPPIGEGSETDRDATPEVEFNGVTPGFFDASGIPLVAGRDFTAADHLAGTEVTIVNQAFADYYWPGEGAVGRRFSHDRGSTWQTIVGVVGDTRSAGLKTPDVPIEYWPQRQVTFAWPDMDVVIDTDLDNPIALAPMVREAIWEVDAEQPIGEIRALDRVVSDSMAGDRFELSLFASFALLALSLGIIGIYGVVSYTAGQRVREIGIRMALGAHKGDVIRSVLGRGLIPVAVGTAAGVGLAAAGSRLLSGLLFEVDPLDLTTYAAVAALLLTVGIAATFIPARRAAAVDPMGAIRLE